MLENQADQSICYWIATTAHSLRRAISQELVSQNMTLRQFEVLAWLAADGEQSQVELAEKLGIESPTLAGILSRMERDGWLEREGCAKDRRRKIIHSTEKAVAVWNNASECSKKVRAQATLGLSKEDLDDLKRICDTIKHNLGVNLMEPMVVVQDDETKSVAEKTFA